MESKEKNTKEKILEEKSSDKVTGRAYGSFLTGNADKLKG